MKALHHDIVLLVVDVVRDGHVRRALYGRGRCDFLRQRVLPASRRG
jgi:hypothetical protein